MKRGMSAGAAIFLVILFAVLVYLLWTFGNIWFDKKWVTGKVRDTIQTRFFESNQVIIDDIVTYGKERKIVIVPEKVFIERFSNDSMRVAVDYNEEVRTPVFTKTYSIHVVVTEGTGGG